MGKYTSKLVVKRHFNFFIYKGKNSVTKNLILIQVLTYNGNAPVLAMQIYGISSVI